jgi:hypothetical protein
MQASFSLYGITGITWILLHDGLIVATVSEGWQACKAWPL